MFAAHLNYATDDIHNGVTLISSSSDQPEYPDDNVANLPISKPWRTVGNASQWIEFDLGATLGFDLIALVNHNLTAGATITIKAGASAAPSTVIGTMTARQFDAFKLFSSLQSYAFVRIEISDPSNVNNFISVGAVLLGASTVLGFGFNFGWQPSDVQNNLTLTTEYNVLHSFELNYQKELSLDFEELTTSQLEQLRQIYLAAKQDIFPFFWIPDAAVNDGYLFRFTEAFRPKRGMRASVSLSFREDSRGQSIGA
jgi:hypothetical protein